MTTRVLRSDEVAAYRAVRLESLRSDPAAFCSTLDRESAFDDATLSERLTSTLGRPAAVIVDETDGEDAAVVGTVGVGDRGDGVAEIVGMWVRPTARGRGVGQRLVDAAGAWAVGCGLDELRLWVIATNGAAIALYERCGFTATGVEAPVPGRDGDLQLEMRRSARDQTARP